MTPQSLRGSEAGNQKDRWQRLFTILSRHELCKDKILKAAKDWTERILSIVDLSLQNAFEPKINTFIIQVMKAIYLRRR